MEPAAPPLSWTVAAPPGRPRVVIVGSGPAGTFCALRLLDYGLEPVVLERGAPMSERVRAVAALWQDGVLDPEANAQFGEGGAGTFSDGKLTTRIGHPAIRYVIQTFVRSAPTPGCCYLARPHVGTDVIRKCSVLIRKDAEARGARYRFRARLADLRFQDGRGGAAVLAIGRGDPLRRPGAGAGAQRPGHPGDAAPPRGGHAPEALRHGRAGGASPGPGRPRPVRADQGHPSLAPADYKLVCNLGPARAAYSFCMCPGGEVIQCASRAGRGGGERHEQRQAGFGLRQFRPGGQGQPADFGSRPPAGGMYFQRRWEQAAFRAAGETYGAPAMSVQDFLRGKATGQLPATSFRPFAVPADLTTCLPGFVQEQLLGAIPDFDRKLHGFTSRQALLLAIESRTSSPVQLLRGDNGESVSHPGLSPAAKAPGSPAASPRRRWTGSGWPSGSPGRRGPRPSCRSSGT